MSDSFITRLLRVALKVTDAERGLAVAHDLTVLERLHIDDETWSDDNFRDFALTWLRRALEDGQTIITNNIITDPTKAPTTNTNFANLRFVVCVPIKDHGAIYFDRHIRNGIIPRDLIDRFNDMVFGIQKNKQEDATEEHLIAVFEKMA